MLEDFNSMNITSVSVNQFSSFVLTREGKVYGFGANEIGTLGDGTFVSKLHPFEIYTEDYLFEKKIKSISTTLHTLAITSEGVVVSWGLSGLQCMCGFDRC